MSHFVIASQTQPPLNPKAGEIWFNPNTGWNILMFWDASRNAWLSVETHSHSFGVASNNISSQYLSALNGTPSDTLSPSINRPFIITSLIATTTSANAKAIIFSVRTKTLDTGVLSGDLVTITITAGNLHVLSNTINTVVATGAKLAAYVSGTKIKNPDFTVNLKYHWT